MQVLYIIIHYVAGFIPYYGLYTKTFSAILLTDELIVLAASKTVKVGVITVNFAQFNSGLLL